MGVALCIKRSERKEESMTYWVINGVVFFSHEEAIAYKKACS